MMFKSKSELIEHLQDLVDCKYLTQNWFHQFKKNSSSATKFFTISLENFEEEK